MSNRIRLLLAGLSVVLLGGIAAVYLVVTGRDAGAAPAPTALSLTEPGVLFVSTADASRGRVGLLPANGGAARFAALDCARVYAAGGAGLCLRQDGALSTYQLAVLGPDLAVRRQIPLVGLPNRARVSPDGRLVAWTVFVTGDSYNGGQFSTRAGILDTRSGDLADTLEDFALTVDGRAYRAADVNVWGVTFARDDRTFYATVASAGHRWLAVGDLAARTLRSVAPDVECPSLSPDGRRIAYKRAVDGNPAKGWRLSVLDLDSQRITELAEARSVDDQAAWLSDSAIGYALPRGGGHSDVWSVPADGTGQPALLIPDAESPAPLG
jgi:hypothetical protein